MLAVQAGLGAFDFVHFDAQHFTPKVGACDGNSNIPQAPEGMPVCTEMAVKTV